MLDHRDRGRRPKPSKRQDDAGGGLAPATGEDLRQRAVWAQLDTVLDPELDEPVTALGFVERVDIHNDGRVAIEFRLPTYWCAANFAFLMAHDMRAAVGALPWVTAVDIRLRDHFEAEAISRGASAGCSFAATFGKAADEEDAELAALRRRFTAKALLTRTDRLLRWLNDRGHTPETVATWYWARLEAAAAEDPEGRRLCDRVHQAREQLRIPTESNSPALVDPEGRPITSQEQLALYLGTVRRTRLAAEANTALCQGLLAVRYSTASSAHNP
jgi:metal-sulfur cluster biosynthetic enzyme